MWFFSFGTPHLRPLRQSPHPGSEKHITATQFRQSGSGLSLVFCIYSSRRIRSVRYGPSPIGKKVLGHSYRCRAAQVSWANHIGLVVGDSQLGVLALYLLEQLGVGRGERGALVRSSPLSPRPRLSRDGTPVCIAPGAGDQKAQYADAGRMGRPGAEGLWREGRGRRPLVGR